MSLEWLTLSRAFKKSSSVNSVCLPTLAFRTISSISMVSWVSHDLFFSKTMLKIIKKVMWIHVPIQVWSHDMFEDLNSMQVRMIGLYFAADDLSLFFFKQSVTCARHQYAGSLLVWRDRSHIICNTGLISSRNSWIKRGFLFVRTRCFSRFKVFAQFLKTLYRDNKFFHWWGRAQDSSRYRIWA